MELAFYIVMAAAMLLEAINIAFMWRELQKVMKRQNYTENVLGLLLKHSPGAFAELQVLNSGIPLVAEEPTSKKGDGGYK